MTDLPIELAGESVSLLPERAIYWPREGALIVADLHWGKAASFRAAGVPIPSGTTSADLARLNRALDRTGAGLSASVGVARRSTGLVAIVTGLRTAGAGPR